MRKYKWWSFLCSLMSAFVMTLMLVLTMTSGAVPCVADEVPGSLSLVMTNALLTETVITNDLGSAGVSTNEALSSFWSSASEVWAKWLSGEGNFSFIPFASYAPKLQNKYGGGLGVFYQVNDYSFVGCRVEAVDGGFFAVAGEAGLKLPIKPLPKIAPDFVVTPFGFIGVAVPVSGATVGNWTIPGTVHNYDGEAVGIVGYGAAVTVWKSKDGKLSAGALFDVETWQYLGKQYRLAANFNVRF